MKKLIDEFAKGLAGSSGQSIGEGIDDISTGLKKIRTAFSKNESDESGKTESLNEKIIRYFTENIKNIEIEQLDASAEYNDILKWASQNKCGNRLYLIRYSETKNNVVFLFAFFGLDDDLFLDEKHPQRCYIAKVLPNSILDLFQDKCIFVQPFK